MAALACCRGQPAHADESGLAALAPTGLAAAGSGVRLGDLRAFVNGLDAPAPADRAFTFTPSIGVTELLTDNVYQVARPRQADLVTTLLPEITLSGQTQRIQANITYSPRIEVYAKTGQQQNQVVQDFNGQALLTAVPDTLFLQLRGYGTQQSTSGNFGQSGLPYYSGQNRTDTRSYEVSPYVMHRFGGDGTVQAGYVMNYSTQTGSTPGSASTLFNNNALLNNPLLNNALPGQSLANGITRSNEEYATFTSGENFGRFTDTLRLDATQYTSTGGSVLSRAHRTTAIDSFGYGVNRTVALLGSVGYEDIAYAGLPPTIIKDLVWSGGIRLTPNESSSLTLTYGHKDGFNAFALSSSYLVTARLRVFANYSEGLTSSAQELQDNVDDSTVDQFGNTLSTATGAPTLISDQLLGLQNALYRLKRFSVTGISTYDRDLFSLTAEQETRQVIASGPVLPGASDRGLSGELSWSHNLTPDLTSTASLRYSHTTTQAIQAQSTDTFGLFLQTSYAFSPTLTGTLEYYVTKQTASGSDLGQFSNTAGQSNGQSFLQNAILIGLHKAL